MNKSFLIGNLTRDPELRTTGRGISVTTFTIAVNRRFKTENGPDADFLNIVTWRGLADNCAKYLQKGSKAGVVGQIQTRNYEDANGVRRYVTEIVADEVEFLSKAPEGQERQEPQAQESKPSADELFAEELSDFQPLDDADLPF